MKKQFLYLIIFLEGYVVLSTELLAIRQLVPFIGNGTETVAIIIAAVLLPLAFGYHKAGNYRRNLKLPRSLSIREKLLNNVIISAVILTLGLSYPLLEIYFQYFSTMGISSRIVQTAAYSMIFIAPPVYLLGQTVPLVSNYFRGKYIANVTGTILTFSTIGSFLGSIFSTLVLMSLIGVHYVVVINTFLLFIVVGVLAKKLLSTPNYFMTTILILTFFLNSQTLMDKLYIVKNNAYHMIQVFHDKDKNASYMLINRSASAVHTDNPEYQFEYIRHLEDHYIKPISTQNTPAKNILVIGAGGFSFGQNDYHNNYTYIDIDPSILEVTEQKLIKNKLSSNKHFQAIPARPFIRQNHEHYDLILLDAYSHVTNIPTQLITVEFFQDIKKHLAPNGIFLCNIITSPTFNEAFARKIDNTLRHVFTHINRQVIGKIDAWSLDQSHKLSNIIYSYHLQPINHDVYTDNINTFFMDRNDT